MVQFAHNSPSVNASSLGSTAHIVISAGEASGDHLAAGLIQTLNALRPNLRFSGLGGTAMRAQGAEIVLDLHEVSVIGLWEVLVQYRQLMRHLQRLEAHLATTRPRLLILVDFVEFNLRLAATAKKLGIPVLFYVSPQLWAWREKRIHRIKRCVDAMAVLFPFEEAIYQRHGIPVRYVGNPLAERIQRPDHDLRSELQIPKGHHLIGLLPGSRRGELKYHWPMLVQTMRLLTQQRPDLHFVVPLAPGLTLTDLNQWGNCSDLPVTVIEGPERSLQVMAQSTLLLTKSGTSTLEAGLLATPMIVFYRMAWLSYWILSRLVRTPDIALVNIVAGKRLVPERIQAAANPAALSQEALELLNHPQRLKAMRTALGQIRERLGRGGANQRVAAMVLEFLDRGRLGQAKFSDLTTLTGPPTKAGELSLDETH